MGFFWLLGRANSRSPAGREQDVWELRENRILLRFAPCQIVTASLLNLFLLKKNQTEFGGFFSLDGEDDVNEEEEEERKVENSHRVLILGRAHARCDM